jgi:hypothetical protein
MELTFGGIEESQGTFWQMPQNARRAGAGEPEMSFLGADEPPKKKRVTLLPTGPPKRAHPPIDEEIERLTAKAKQGDIDEPPEKMMSVPSGAPRCLTGVDFEVKDTGDRGLGLFALKDIKKGTVVTRYGGTRQSTPGDPPTHTLRLPRRKGVQGDAFIDALSVKASWEAGDHEGAYREGVAGLCNSSGPPGEGDAEASCGIAWGEEDEPLLVTLRDVRKPERGGELLWAYRWR